MKLKDLFESISKEESNSGWVCYSDIAEEIGIYDWVSEGDRIKYYWAEKWLCTDTWVGCKLFYLDDEPVFMTCQNARKNSEHYYWYSKEAYEKVRSYILSLVDSYNEPILADLDEVIDERYTVSYGSQLLTDVGEYNGLPVKVVKVFDRYDEISLWSSLVVSDGVNEFTIDCSEFKIKIPLNNKQEG